MFKIAYYTAVDSCLSVIDKAYDSIDKSLIELKVWHKRSLSLKRKEEEFLEYLKAADFFIVQLMGNEDSLPGFYEIMESLSSDIKVYIHGTTGFTDELAKKYNTVSKEVASTLFEYMVNNGSENLENMFKYLIHEYDDGGDEYESPKVLPFEGIYHHKLGMFENLEDYLKINYKPEKITIGISFLRNYWLNEDIAFVTELINAIENADCNVIPIFLSTFKNSEIGHLGVAGACEKYFIRDSEPIIDSLINIVMFSNGIVGHEYTKYLGILDVPIIQAILNPESYKIWKKENHGLIPTAISVSVALPEFDGGIITVPIANKETIISKNSDIPVVAYTPCAERIKKIVNIAKNYALLSKIPSSEKKIAIIMHNYPPKNETIGCAYGLDTHQSIINILKALKDDGVLVERIYSDTKELMDEILSYATGHEEWNTEEKIKNTNLAAKAQYRKWFDRLDGELKQIIVNKWGEPVGKGMTYKDSIIIPGSINGNVFIGIQPTRGFSMDPGAIYHSPDIPIGHHYYAYYQWLKNEFGANVVIHVGKHGSLEWLPGKAVGLSNTCNPDCSIDNLPNIYPYIINNPGEGTQAKRRSYATLIDHLEPAMENADIYDELAALENKIDEYYEAKGYQSDKCELIKEEIEKLFIETGLNNDINIEGLEFDESLEKIHSYLNEMKDTLISNGLHIFGEAPKDEALVKFLVALTRLDNQGVLSLREAMAKSKGFTIDELYDARGKLVKDNKTGGQIIEDINDNSIELVKFVLDNEDESIKKYIQDNYPTNIDEIYEIVLFVKHNLLGKVLKTENEMKNLVRAINGKFVPPGGSGAPTRGQVEILPTGRNFYSVNPFAIPSQFAWKTGIDLANILINRYINDNGEYPESVGMILFGSPTMRTKGEDLAEILYLLGVKPIWQEASGTVKSFEIIPLEKLKRPRIDVTVRASGFFRDAFRNLMEFIDEAVQAVGNLDEPEDMNFIAKHIKEDINELVKEGMEYNEARQKSSYRVFSAKPGAYGTGVNTLIDEKNWSTNADITNVYLEWGSYAYSKDVYGEFDKDIFKRRLSKLNVAVKNIDTKETDVLANDDNYAYLGGMIAAASELKGEKIEGIVGDSSDPVRVKARNIKEETKFVIRTKLLNPKWYNGLKKHGYKGAMDISRVIDYTFGWDATTDAIDDWTYEQITDKFINDEDFSEWMKENNPWAMQNIIERMLEAIQRGMWKADEKTIEDLTNKYLENESLLEGDN